MTADSEVPNIGKALRRIRFERMPLKASEVARWEGITPGAARRALQKLQAEGLVRQNEIGYWEAVERETP